MLGDALDLPRDDDGRIVGFAVGREARMRDWLHRKEQVSSDRLVNILRATKWNREHPERRREINARHYRRPGVKDRQLERKREARAEAYRRNPIIYTCAECGASWCRVPWVRGVAPRFCGQACYQRARYQERTPGARRTRRHDGR